MKFANNLIQPKKQIKPQAKPQRPAGLPLPPTPQTNLEKSKHRWGIFFIQKTQKYQAKMQTKKEFVFQNLF